MTQEEIIKRLKEIYSYLNDPYDNDWLGAGYKVEELIDKLEKSDDAH